MMKNLKSNLSTQQFPKTLIVLCCLFVCTFQLAGQGWEFMFNDEVEMAAKDVIETPEGLFTLSASSIENDQDVTQIVFTDLDGNFQYKLSIPGMDGNEIANSFVRLDDGSFVIVGGYEESPLSFGNGTAFIMKVDSDGNLIWQKLYSENIMDTWVEKFNKIITTSDDGFLVAGYRGEDNLLGIGNYGSLIVKMDADGVEEWHKNIFDVSDLKSIIATTDGNYVYTGSESFNGNAGASKVVKIDAQGDNLWTYIYNEEYSSFGALVETEDQNIVVAGNITYGLNTSDTGPMPWLVEGTDIIVIKLSADGSQVLFNKTHSKAGHTEDITDIATNIDGSLLIAGTERATFNNEGFRGYLLKIDDTGEFIWRTEYGTPIIQTNTFVNTLKIANDGGYILCGYDDVLTDTRIYLAKADGDGLTSNRFLGGNVFHDMDADCLKSPSELNLENWIVTIEGSDQIYSTYSDSDGNFLIQVDSGAYNVTVTYPTYYWMACEEPAMAEVSNQGDSIYVDLAIGVEHECPYMTVDVGTPFIRWCSDDNYYTISYCNRGTVVAEDAYVEIDLDEYLSIIGSSIPIANQNGNIYTFNLGDVGVNECNSFVINVALGCEEEYRDFTHCTEAHIYPDSLCGDFANWDGSSIEVEGICQGDSITFIITNVGNGDMSEPGNYLIVEDQIMMLQGNFTLASGESTSITLPTTGGTFRIETNQTAGHPGNSMPSAVIEGCGDAPFSLNFFNLFELNDGDNYIDIDCIQNISSYDPNDKLGIPMGYGEDNYIRPGTDIDYRIRFQNTGTDTAFNVVLKDHLSPWLDVASIRLGASSHPYEFSIEDNNILVFTFNNIMLPDSTVNEVLSHGFIKFKVSHIENIPLGTQINNSTGIYFDANPVVITNTTLHTVEENFIEIVSIDEVDGDLIGNQLTVYPNPVSDYAIFELKNKIQDGQFKLLNSAGQLIQAIKVSGDQFRLDANDLPKGVYFFQILDQNHQQYGGKLIIH